MIILYLREDAAITAWDGCSFAASALVPFPLQGPGGAARSIIIGYWIANPIH
jgi:hypothetical protein